MLDNKIVKIDESINSYIIEMQNMLENCITLRDSSESGSYEKRWLRYAGKQLESAISYLEYIPEYTNDKSTD